MSGLFRVGKTLLSMACVCYEPAHSAPLAGDYPVKPIRLVVPFPAGGGTDIVARTVSAKLTEAWGQQIIIDNRGGAGGVIGADTVAKSTPDGYTLLFGTPGALIINPLLNSKLPYDSVRDFAPISLIALNPQLLAVHNSLPVGTVRELIALAKARPGKLNYASVGEGTPNHLAMELFKSMTGTDIAHIPYKGAAPAVTDLLGGQVQVMFNPMPPLMPHVKSGKLKALAVGSTRRSSALPDVPTVAEAGVPGYEYVTWYSIVAPAKTPPTVIREINARLAAVMSNPEVAQRLASQGAEPRSSTPAELAKFIQEDFKRLGSVIRSAGIRVE